MPKLPKVPTPRAVLTPGSYKGKVTPKKVTPKKAKVGRPVQKKSGRKNEKRREKYTQADLCEAIRLVREEEYSILRASEVVNDIKKNPVPRMTLSDRLKRAEGQEEEVALGRPQELSPATEMAIVQSMEMCAEFQYPMTKTRLRDLVQDVCNEQDKKTRWPDNR